MFDPRMHHYEINGIVRYGNVIYYIAYNALIEGRVICHFWSGNIEADKIYFIPILVILRKLPCFPGSNVYYRRHLWV